MIHSMVQFAADNWRSAIEIGILWVVIYNAYLYFRGTRGAKVLTGLALALLTLIFVSQLLRLEVILWLIRSITAFLAVALVVIFQPELRRALAALGSHHFFTSTPQNRETIEVISDMVFELSNRQFGALIAIERDINIAAFAETGVQIDCELSPELVVTIFQPKTPLHDGGLILRNDRILAAACIFPVSQREDLDRNLGLRHRAALGLSEESDAVTLVVSEESGIVSICHRGKIERNFDPESLKLRLGELFLQEESDEKSDTEELGGENRFPGPRERPLVSHQKEP
ncbi:MAG TPA: diadenylate cyclase CdaA [Chthoniobacteraceae bacterium]|jgi:diadenylate cyclase|nr:diadenylate cyclase CdaA [Chthoniobacteraceae bacterium]